jgi:hypothetical protein
MRKNQKVLVKVEICPTNNGREITSVGPFSLFFEN